MMDDRQIQARIELVQALLGCPVGQEDTILQQHQDLLDKGLLQVMNQMVEMLRQQGQRNTAYLIEQMMAQLARAVVPENTELPESATSGELQTIVQAIYQISDSRSMLQRAMLCQQALSLVSREDNEKLWAELKVALGNSLAQALQGNRAQNIEDAIAAYQQALQVMTREVMPTEWATLTVNIATVRKKRLRGDRAQNIEDAITAYKQSLQVRTREAMPSEWATSMNNLATAYSERLRGDRAQNIEDAITAYKQSLQVRTREAMPSEWATSMMNLANAYSDRIQGDRAQNMEDAIAAYKQSLQVRTREAMPLEWATSMNNMAIAYKDRIRGDRAQNIEDAITAYKQSLQVRTREAMPSEWATSMNNMAIAYNDRIRGDRAQNIEDAIAAYQQALQVRERKSMPLEWAESMMNLATAYSNRIRGDRAQNIEDAIATYKQALQVMLREAMPIDWAKLMNNLATAYKDRIRGDHSQNIEDAIMAYEKSLQVMTRETMPIDWANLMMNLGTAYDSRLRGDRAQNIEDAIMAYKQSLQVRTREAMPIDWAESMMNLASAYAIRLRDDRAQNVENAIMAYKQSLQVRTREAMPIDWAESMMNLANAYYSRIQGDRAQNIEDAIATYQQALQVMSREAMPVEWATSMNNLANAYVARIRGDRAQNIEDAIRACEQSLEVMTREAMPVEWATSMNNLANAYVARIRGDHAQNVEDAVEAYEQSLQVRTKETMPIDWAKSTMNLGTAYAARTRGDRTQNIEDAIAAYEQSLEIVTREAMPVDWAKLTHNLAFAYYNRIRGDRSQNAKDAIKACSQAIEIFTPETHPNDCRRTARLLANLYVDESRWNDAQASYRAALDAVEILYQAALSKGSQEAELSETNDLYRRAAYAYAKVSNLEAAIATLEQGRARGLSETLQRDRTDLETIRQIKPELVERYQTAANAINQLESTERHLITDSQSPQYSQEDFRQQATQARQSLKSCIVEIRQIPGYERFLSLPTFEDVAATVQPNHPLIYLVSTPNGSLALILTTAGTSKPEISSLWLNDLTEPQLIDVLYDEWFGAYRDSRTNRQAWLDTIDEITQQIWESMMAPLIDYLQRNNLLKAVLIPTGYVSYLPLHAAWTQDTTKPSGRRYACDDIQFTYTPNALSLSAASSVAKQTSANTLLVVNEPQPVNAGNLPSSSSEAAKAISAFGKGNWKLLQQGNATRTAVLEQLPQKNVVHFSCHGLADFATPLNSGLLMANNEILSLRDLLDLKLQSLRLAILSACETGIPGTKLPDEVISLPTGLLQAGAAGVVSSLWSVADLSTMVLLSRFYELWRSEDLEPPEALQQAQIWLRDSNGPTLAPYLESSHPDFAHKLAQKHGQRPFSHPFYWAAFTYVGV